MLYAIFWLASKLIELYTYAIIATVIVSLLINFGVVNQRSQFVYAIADFLARVTEPVLAPIRRWLPNFGNVDVSPVVAILLLQALQYVLVDVYQRLLAAGLGF